MVETGPSPFKPPGGFADFRTWLTAVVVFGFFCAYALTWWSRDAKDLDLMDGALIASFSTAVGYWLGSSRSSDAKSGTIDAQSGAISTLAAKVDPPSSEPLV
jgi:hypothetical protein